VTAVLCVDDHPALRAGVVSVLRRDPDIDRCDAVDNAADALAWVPVPDVALVDYRLASGDGLRLCQAFKHGTPAPAVLMYSAHAEDLALAARLAGADGVLAKTTPAPDLLQAIRAVAGGGRVFASLTEDVIRAGACVEPEDLPLVAMLADGATADEVAEVMRIEPTAVERRLHRAINQLKPSTVA
jgi:DNA-binding NarL/FixJ family response regulator